MCKDKFKKCLVAEAFSMALATDMLTSIATEEVVERWGITHKVIIVRHGQGSNMEAAMEVLTEDYGKSFLVVRIGCNCAF